MKTALKNNLAALVGYFLLTLLMTYPTLTKFTTAIPGDGFDGWQNYWNQWWIKEALLNQQTHFFFTDILYPPTGVSLLFHTLNYFNGLFTLPIQLNWGLTAAYNAVVFFHFTFAGFGVFLLARYTLAQLQLTGPGHLLAAFIAGVIFTFSPFHMAHLLGHMQVLSLTWPPFYILWLFRTLNEWRKTPTQPLNPGDLALSGLFLALVTMVDWYQTLYMLIFTALLLMWVLWRVWRDNQIDRQTLLRPIVGVAAMGLVFGAIFAPLILPMAAEASTATYMKPSFEENIVLSADLLAFFTPSELHPVWGEALLPLYSNYTTTTSERLIFAGFVPLLLAGIGLVAYWRRKTVRFWALFTLTFFVLALGPFLHIAGNIIKIGGTNLPLPYLLLYKVIPFIGISRSLSRFDLMVMIGLGVLAAVGVMRWRRWGKWVALGLILFEFVAIPYPMSAVDTPDYFNQLAAEPGDFSIAYLPMNWDRPVPLLYQTTHGKALLTAYTSRNNPLDTTWRTPVLQQWRTLQTDIIHTDLAAIAPTVLHDFNVRYIILDYYQMPPGAEREATEQWVAAALPNVQPFYHDERITAYQSPPATQLQPYVQLAEGWGNLVSSEGVVTRRVESPATIKVNHLVDSNAILRLQAAPGETFINLQAYNQDQEALPLSFAQQHGQADIELPPDTTELILNFPQPIHIQAVALLAE